MDLKNTLELIKWVQELTSHTAWPSAAAWVNSIWFAIGVAGIGLLLALWGSRLLRTVVVLVFMAVGAVVGRRVASAESVQVDLLIGVVLGAGVAGLIGYACYRWWLAMMVGVLVTVVLLATFSASRLLEERQSFEAHRLGMGQSFAVAIANDSSYSAEEVINYFWGQRRELLIKTLLPVILVGVLAFSVSLLMPRLTSIVGTSVLGTLTLAGGGALLLTAKWPSAWASIQSHPVGTMIGIGLFGLFAVMYQFTHSRRIFSPRPVVHQPTASAA